LGYAGIALAVAGIWWLLPLPSLILFLLLSVQHFGAGDAEDAFGVIVHGSLPIVVPAAMHPDAVGELFALLTGGDADGWQLALRTAQPTLLAGTLLAVVARLWIRRAGPRGELLELITVAMAGALLPPLLSFALYFCVWHAPRHMLLVAHELWPGATSRGLARFAVAAMPMSVVSLTVGGAAVAMLSDQPAGVEERWLQVAFIGLAALTVPHLLVTQAVRGVSLRAVTR
jgi:Brp/Blh family beta-carotene 15,15'-monooxygenase